MIHCSCKSCSDLCGLCDYGSRVFFLFFASQIDIGGGGNKNLFKTW